MADFGDLISQFAGIQPVIAELRDPSFAAGYNAVVGNSANWGGAPYPLGRGSFNGSLLTGGNAASDMAAIFRRYPGAASASVNAYGPPELGSAKNNEPMSSSLVLQTHDVLHTWDGLFSGANRIDKGEFVFAVNALEDEPIPLHRHGTLRHHPVGHRSQPRLLSWSAVNDLLFAHPGVFSDPYAIKRYFRPQGINMTEPDETTITSGATSGRMTRRSRLCALAHSGPSNMRHAWDEFAPILIPGATVGAILTPIPLVPSALASALTAATATKPAAAGASSAAGGGSFSATAASEPSVSGGSGGSGEGKSADSESEEEEAEYNVDEGGSGSKRKPSTSMKSSTPMKRSRGSSGGNVFVVTMDDDGSFLALAASEHTARQRRIEQLDKAATVVWQFLPWVSTDDSCCSSAMKLDELLHGQSSHRLAFGTLAEINADGGVQDKRKRSVSSLRDATFISAKGRKDWMAIAEDARLDDVTVQLDMRYVR